MNWEIDNSKTVQRSFDKWSKNHSRELISCLANLGRVQQLLRAHGDVTKFQIGFFRSERHNVWRIGQTGVPHAHETRLYIYLYVSGKTIFPLLVGDKNSQQADIRECHRIANGIKNEKNSKH